MMLFKDWVETLTPAQIEAWNLDQATIDNLNDYFYYREIFDDVKMYRIFSRTINILRDKYVSMVRVESISFDPLVSKYFEAEYITTKDGTNVKTNNGTNTTYHKLGEQVHDYGSQHGTGDVTTDESKSSEINGLNTETVEESGHNSKTGTTNRTEQTTGNSTSTGSSSNSTTGSTSDRTTTTGTRNSTTVSHEDEIDRNAVKAAPMNASGVGIGNDGHLTGLGFNYSSSYGQNDMRKNNDETTNGSDNTNVTGSGSSSTRGTGTTSNSGQTSGNLTGYDNKSESGSTSNDRTGRYGIMSHQEDGRLTSETSHDNQTHSNFIEKSGVNTDETVLNGSTNGATNENILQRDRYAGRDGVLPQDAMASATHYLMTYSTAFQWLCNKLESCFIGVYDI